MNRYCLLLLALLFYVLPGFCQDYQDGDPFLTDLRQSNMISSYSPPARGFERVYYYDNDYQNSTLYLKNGDTLNNIQAKVDFHNDQLVVDYKRKKLVINSMACLKLDLAQENEHHCFVPMSYEGNMLFVELLQPSCNKLEGNQYNLVRKWMTYELRPNYNPATDSGSKEGKIDARNALFILNRKNGAFIKMPKNRRRMKKMLLQEGVSISESVIKSYKYKDLDSFIPILSEMNSNR